LWGLPKCNSPIFLVVLGLVAGPKKEHHVHLPTHKIPCPNISSNLE
jgi:hypothetical protein